MCRFSWLFDSPYVLLAELFFHQKHQTSEREKNGIIQLNGSFEILQIVIYSKVASIFQQLSGHGEESEWESFSKRINDSFLMS